MKQMMCEISDKTELATFSIRSSVGTNLKLKFDEMDFNKKLYS